MNSVTLDPVTGMVNQQDMVVKTEFTADTKMMEDDDGMPEDDDGANIGDHLDEHVLETSMVRFRVNRITGLTTGIENCEMCTIQFSLLLSIFSDFL